MKKIIRGVEVEYKGCKFTVELEYYYDEELEEEYEDKELGNENLRKIRNEYRRLNNLLLDYQIKQIRDRYDLSQKDFAILLGLGEVTITRYESKTIQDKAQDEIIRKAKNPEEFYEIALRNKEKYVKEYSELKFNQVLKEIEKLFSTNCVEVMYSKRSFPQYIVGNQELSLDKTYSLIYAFINKVGKLTKTKLAKFLYYVDNLSYKDRNVGVTGLSYCHLNHGPVPFMYEEILNSDLIEIETTYNDDSMICLIKKCDIESNLEEYELSLVNQIANKFKDMNTSEVVNYSHKEIGYLETKKNEYISYDYSKYIDFNRS